jgi:hypothetical protein
MLLGSSILQDALELNMAGSWPHIIAHSIANGV